MAGCGYPHRTQAEYPLAEADAQRAVWPRWSETVEAGEMNVNLAGRSGLLVGAGFGLAFVLANAGSPLTITVGLALRLLAGGLFAVVLASTFRATRLQAEQVDTEPTKAWYGRRFWWIVIGEVVLLIVGLQVLRITNAPTQANVAWIALVVGLHFIGFALVWKEPSIAVPGAFVMLLGVAGLTVAATSAKEWVPLLSGVASGFVLLAGCLGAAMVQSGPTPRQSPS